VIAVPPLLAGAVYGTLAVVPLNIAVPIVGVPGTAHSVVLLLALLAVPAPTELIACTVNV
jgi:hypothetical protein